MIFPWNLFMGPIPSVYWLSRFLILSVFMVQQGCTGPSVPALQWGPWEPHVTEEVRAKIRTIGVAVTEELPRVTIELPSKGPASGAGRKARKWSGNWVWAAGEAFILIEKGGDLLTMLATTATSLAMLVVTPVVAAAGAVAGAFEAPSAETVESQEAQVRGVLQVEDLIHRFQDHLRKDVTDLTDISVSPLLRTANDPLGDRESVPTNGEFQPDAMLRILVKSIDLRGPFDVDPLLAVNLEVQATLVAPSAVAPLYPHTFHYVSGARRLTEWTADDAQVFLDAVELSLARLGELMVDDLFLTHPFVHEHQRVRHGG